MTLARMLLVISALLLPGCWHLTRMASTAGNSDWRMERPLPDPVVMGGTRGYPAKRIGDNSLMVQFWAQKIDTQRHQTVFLRTSFNSLGDVQTKPHRFRFQKPIGEDDIVWEMISYKNAEMEYSTASAEMLIWSHPDNLRDYTGSPVPGQKFTRIYSERSIVRQIAVIPAYVVTVPLDIVTSPFQVVYDAFNFSVGP